MTAPSGQFPARGFCHGRVSLQCRRLYIGNKGRGLARTFHFEAHITTTACLAWAASHDTRQAATARESRLSKLRVRVMQKLIYSSNET
jgi:hypothetical protein